MSLENYAKIVFALGEYYSKPLTPSQIRMYAEDLMSLSPEELTLAIKAYKDNSENIFFPLPAQLIAVLRPIISNTDEANEVANLIIKAMGSCGYTNPEKAKEKIGELGWEVVQRLGTWENLCKNTMNDELPTLRAQIRGLVEVVSKRAKRGELEIKPSLPSSEIKSLITNTMKGIDRDEKK